MGGRQWLALALVGGLSGLLGGVCGAWLVTRPGVDPPAAATLPQSPSPTAAAVPDGAESQVIAAAARRVNVAVVNIDTYGRAAGGGFNPFEDVRRPPGATAPGIRGSGSGFLVDAAKGYLITNQHVVEGAEEVKVTLDDDRRLDAKVVGADKLSDIAVLQITADKLPAAPLARGAKLVPGEWVIAIGNPFRDFPHTVTVGVVSALNRNMQLPGRDYNNLIQTDAAINMGNSGGPLCNLQGEVIGVNVAIASPTGTYAGLGFAIVIDDAWRIAQHLIAHGGVPWLGVATAPLDAETAARLGLRAGQGILVDSVRAEGPADRAGLRAQDVVLSVDGTPVEEPGKLQQQVLAAQPGTVLKLRVKRGSRDLTVRPKLGTRPGG
ncbi:MAG: trypsin-like peptidase domain-containing protein [Fimbriimonadaceae bacterium]|nr:trypsin-like peptidase domain-containing protein [Fimbriimonadaceae bacterium]